MPTNKKAVYTIIDRPTGGRKLWLRVGDAVVQRDGSVNVRLDALPVNGILHIRGEMSTRAPVIEAAAKGEGE